MENNKKLFRKSTSFGDLVWESNGNRTSRWNSQAMSDSQHHYNFVEGRKQYKNDRFEEWIPELMPAGHTRSSGVQYYGDQESQPKRNHRAASVTGEPEQETNPENQDTTDRESESTFQPTNSRSTQRVRPRSASEPRAQQTLSIAGNEMAGRGRGRGGAGAGAGAGQLKGATWEYDASIQLESKPADLFPKHPNLRKPAPITTKERREIDNFKKLQDQIHRGPLYTQPTKRDPNAPAKTFGEEQFNKQFGTNSKANMDPFHGVETYSMRYAPKQRTLPKLSDQPFNKTLFPEELWSTLEGEEGQEVRNHLNRAMERKEAMLASMKAAENGAGSGAGNGADNGADKGAGADASAKTKILLEKIHKVAGDEDNEELEEEQDAEDVDDAYEDEDLGEDYNAEGYFDDGEDDQEDEADGGDENY